MKYEGQRPSGSDKDISLYTFSVGKEELRIILESLVDVEKRTVKSTDTQVFRSRLQTLIKQLSGIWQIAKGTKTVNHYDSPTPEDKKN